MEYSTLIVVLRTCWFCPGMHPFPDSSHRYRSIQPTLRDHRKETEVNLLLQDACFPRHFPSRFQRRGDNIVPFFDQEKLAEWNESSPPCHTCPWHAAWIFVIALCKRVKLKTWSPRIVSVATFFYNGCDTLMFWTSSNPRMCCYAVRLSSASK